ncbi:2-hydroxychromene-2-carboxylate isomerase [Monaibacterium marinum]|uniref:2-hydroxychromene-2-carboxylate isomerase n=1 Tax=Pontivivens marinum TaxID=1690039 RepID=A0A2C9CUJ9_9RHOB|nr:DsbA family protein [Monaibacterium marinum]SOH94994.1 2-hydroxychromene-2-carboxylate isomerase [Monaibacterium marinum]
MRGTYFFSFRSPYSWLASMGLKRLIDAGDALELVPFFEPDAVRSAALQAQGGVFPYTPMSDAKHRYILKDVKRLTTRFGVSHVWPVDPDPWWEASHLGFLAARRLGHGLPFFWQVYRARWELGLDISRTETIAQICRSAGMDARQTQIVCDAPQDAEISSEGVAALHRVWMEDVFGTPMFTKRRTQFWGIDRLPDFLAAIDEDLDAQVPAGALATTPLEFDHAGGCG